MSVVQSGFSIDTPLSVSLAQGTASGSLGLNATYNYAVTYLTNFGESLPSSTSSLSTGTGSIVVTIPVVNNVNVTGVNLYRTAAYGSNLLFVAKMSQSPFIINTYTDTMADSSLGVAVPINNTANSSQIIQGNVAFSQLLTFSTNANVSASGSPYTLLSNSYNVINTAANNQGVMLAAAFIVGAKMTVVNMTNTSVEVYTYTSQYLNGVLNGSYTLAANATVEFITTSEYNWTVVVPYANLVSYSVTSGITATLSPFPILSSSYNIVNTVTTAGYGVMLASATNVGFRMVVTNNSSANSMNVVPFTGQYINGTLNLSLSIATNTSAVFIVISANNWETTV